MRIFSILYTKILEWSKHRHAPYYLYGLSFAESSFFPIPPDFMLAPMALAKPDSAWTYAALTTIASVLGGVLGYLIGMWAFSFVYHCIIQFGYEHSYQQIVTAFNKWDFWVMLVAGFAPIPYKLFTIAAGATHIAMLPFVLGSLLGRGGRFFLVALFIWWGGERMERILMRSIDWLGWLLVVSLLVVLVVSLTGCSSATSSAPVAERWHQQRKIASNHVVQHTNTVSRSITKENNVRLSSPAATVPISRPQVMAVKTVKKGNVYWAWPVLGKSKPVKHFTAGSLNKGIDIPAKKGSAVLAAAQGRVVYAGCGLRGYGMLIIIRHNSEYLSAYAHNEKLLIKEGQLVKVGQVIATTGNTDAARSVLHFEIRRAGKPVNPLKYLPPRT